VGGVLANRWWVVAATVLALIVSAGPINVFSFGVFLKPITTELGIGPALSGVSFDRFHSYTPIFAVYVIMLLVTCVIFLRLGPYPYPAGRHAVAGAPATAPA
jgi:hypothetical protein